MQGPWQIKLGLTARYFITPLCQLPAPSSLDATSVSGRPCRKSPRPASLLPCKQHPQSSLHRDRAGIVVQAWGLEWFRKHIARSRSGFASAINTRRPELAARTKLPCLSGCQGAGSYNGTIRARARALRQKASPVAKLAEWKCAAYRVSLCLGPAVCV